MNVIKYVEDSLRGRFAEVDVELTLENLGIRVTDEHGNKAGNCVRLHNLNQESVDLAINNLKELDAVKGLITALSYKKPDYVYSVDCSCDGSYDIFENDILCMTTYRLNINKILENF